MYEIKRLAELKAKKDKFEKKLKKVLILKQWKAREEELIAYKTKREKMLKEYTHRITFRDDPLCGLLRTSQEVLQVPMQNTFGGGEGEKSDDPELNKFVVNCSKGMLSITDGRT
nr:hypothetical protein [Tanacetum cinerariifolium]